MPRTKASKLRAQRRRWDRNCALADANRSGTINAAIDAKAHQTSPDEWQRVEKKARSPKAEKKKKPVKRKAKCPLGDVLEGHNHYWTSCPNNVKSKRFGGEPWQEVVGRHQTLHGDDDNVDDAILAIKKIELQSTGMCFLPGHDHAWKECPNNHKSKNFCGTDHRLIEQGLKKCSVPEHEHRWKDCPYNPKSEHHCGISLEEATKIEKDSQPCTLIGHDHLWKDCPNNPKSKHFCGISAKEVRELESLKRKSCASDTKAKLPTVQAELMHVYGSPEHMDIVLKEHLESLTPDGMNLPMEISQFYKQHFQSSEIVLDVHKSTYRNLPAFMQAMEEDGIVVLNKAWKTDRKFRRHKTIEIAVIGYKQVQRYKSNELDESESSGISDEDSEASEDSESSSTTRSADGCKLESEDSDGDGSDVEYESESSETSDEEASEYSESSSTTSSSNGCKPESEDSDEDSNDVSHEDKVMGCSKEAMDRKLNEHIVNLVVLEDTLPITAGSFYSKYVISRNKSLDVRRSSYPSVTKWLCALEREGHLKLKRGRRGVLLIVDFRNLVNIIS